ncbi:hypothetical protein [Halomonas sp. HAL1]|uniref:hypothetical protein n=1 Tax=Halomonas sp. HAL1 TaxID=550984 RepID=UPI00022D2AEF|nr:hypothetical protein [Halomonas sp. HAL1]EHA15430.1 hypothetical protein HAL1_11939 [Halomonas sp. HAL1]WKV93975.1 hypothetical protein Q3Y66_04880 [Halomonas sp. HAL1]
MFEIAILEEEAHLSTLVNTVLYTLRKSIKEIEYPHDLRKKSNMVAWEQYYKEIDALNEDIFSALNGRAGVYAILTARPTKEWHLRYIGQTDVRGSKQRIRSHIVWRNKSTKSGKFTGSKFDEVQHAVVCGADIAISFVEIAPASLRHYVEEILIKTKQPEWNLKGTTLQGQSQSARSCVL